MPALLRRCPCALFFLISLFRCITGVSANGRAIFVGPFASPGASSARNSATRGVFACGSTSATTSFLVSFGASFAAACSSSLTISFGASLGAPFAGAFAFDLLATAGFVSFAGSGSGKPPDSRVDLRVLGSVVAADDSAAGSSGDDLFLRVDVVRDGFSAGSDVATGTAVDCDDSALDDAVARGFFAFARENLKPSSSSSYAIA